MDTFSTASRIGHLIEALASKREIREFQRMRALTIAATVFLVGCGAIFNNSQQSVYVTSSAYGEILVDNQPTGVPTPGYVTVDNHNSHVIGVRANDGAIGTCQLPASVSAGYVILDVVFTWFVGVIIDAVTGAWKNVDDTCHVYVMPRR